MASVDVDMGEFSTFFQRLGNAAKGDFRKELELFLEGLGNEFLRIVQDEIIRRKVLDTRLLLASFEKDTDGNVWRMTEGGLTLEVGTSVAMPATSTTVIGRTAKAWSGGGFPAIGRATDLSMTRQQRRVCCSNKNGWRGATIGKVPSAYWTSYFRNFLTRNCRIGSTTISEDRG